MADHMRDMGKVELIGAEAIGQPGGRRFRVYARGERDLTLSLWTEKEQLNALSIALGQLLAQATSRFTLRPEAMAHPTTPERAPADFPATPDIEIAAGTMQVAYDLDARLVILRAASVEALLESDFDASEGFEPAVSLEMTQAQAARLSDSIATILTAGRPLCPICKRPMEPQHLCPKENGFHPAALN